MFHWYSVEEVEDGKFAVFSNNINGVHRRDSAAYKERETAEQLKTRKEELKKRIDDAIASAIEEIKNNPELVDKLKYARDLYNS